MASLSRLFHQIAAALQNSTGRNPNAISYLFLLMDEKYKHSLVMEIANEDKFYPYRVSNAIKAGL